MTVAEAVQAERQLAETLEGYAGRWVAVCNHEVVADATTLEELLGKVEEQEIEAVFEVAEDRAAACFF